MMKQLDISLYFQLKTNPPTLSVRWFIHNLENQGLHTTQVMIEEGGEVTHSSEILNY